MAAPPRKNATLADRPRRRPPRRSVLPITMTCRSAFAHSRRLPGRGRAAAAQQRESPDSALDASLEERHPVDPKDDDAVMRHELERLESKLNVIMQTAVAPARARERRCRASASSGSPPMASSGTTTCRSQLESVGIVSLHINRTLPYPLELAGHVVGCHADRRHVSRRLCVRRCRGRTSSSFSRR